MARKPRPVDPADGPTAAFAYDLRKVREEAGNPTYRALAAVAGYSATTLSDAAGGVRQPSLDVTLAYVGACGGDTALWERRWHELDRALEHERNKCSADEAGAAERSGGESAEEESAPARTAPGPAPALRSLPPAGGVAPGPGRSPVWVRWSLTAAAVAVMAAIGLTTLWVSGLSRTQRSAEAVMAGPVCLSAGPLGPFSGTTYNPRTAVRAGAHLDAPVVLEVPPGCSLRFTGYCLGEPVVDTTSGSPDVRWFKVSQGGVVSSAVIHGNPPAAMQPSSCPDSVPSPSAVRLAAVRPLDSPEAVELRSTGSHLAIVGYAAYFAPAGDPAQGPKWQQIGLTDKASAGFPVSWRLGALRAGAPAGASVPVVAVACLGGGAPTGVADAWQVPLDAVDGGRKAELGEDDLVKAEQAACRYPHPG
ncbi:helix-turn-helix domain-containing protein [Saccharothrix sp. ST-888]|uniref:helix-turn-helix domain-containing protein n=1 Tax=Saccharothrix sp. ST-888 TaxID=1427391 RepID=UPI0006984547|nr:helix-turn-helix transcriptional regulator [Saccharothrix sp. ST-888]